MSNLVYFKKSKLDTLADKINEKCGGGGGRAYQP